MDELTICFFLIFAPLTSIMAESQEKYTKRRVQTSSVSTVISIALVLFMLGLVGMIILHARKLSTYVKENIVFSVYIKENVKEADILKMQKSFDAMPFVKSTEYIDKEQAAKILQEDLGEDFIDFLGYNPLTASMDIKLKADFANSDSLTWIEKELYKDPKVKDVEYHKSLLDMVNENVRKISIVILSFSALLLVIAIALINNSIRLAIYSKRFLIRTMQLVGATKNFIRWPFIARGILHGIYGSLVAIILLMVIVYYARQEVPELFEIEDLTLFVYLFTYVIVMGIVISGLSTYLAVTKYLRMKPENLF